MVEIKVRKYACGYCTQKEKSYKKGGTEEIQSFPGNSFVIETPRGIVIFDTGYSEHFVREAYKLPYYYYAKLIPVHFQPENSLLNQLKRDGISPIDVKYVLISHFHSDHYSGLKDFPYSKVISTKNGFQHIKNIKGLRALVRGFIPKLMPADLEDRLHFCEEKQIISLPDSLFPFTDGFDLLGDKSIIGIRLEGHARGQFGILVNDSFLVADAVWSEDFITRNIEQSCLANIITDNNRKNRENQNKIREIYKRRNGIQIYFGHQR